MVEKATQLVDLRRARACLFTRPLDVFAILPAPGVRTERRRNERQRALNAVIPHLAQSVREHRMPVAVAPINRKSRPVQLQLVLQRRDQSAVLLVDGAAAAEPVIMFGDFEQALAWDVPL